MPAGWSSTMASRRSAISCIQNAKFFLNEYRVDGFRYDQVSVIDHDGAPNGWSFCQDLTSTLHAASARRA